MARILLVDDEKHMLKVLATVLESAGHFDVVATPDGNKAAEILKTDKIDLLITDMRMAPMDGIEMLRIARETNPKMPVILITAYSTLETAIQAHDLGVFDYVPKPFRVDELIEVVERAIKYTSNQSSSTNVDPKNEVKYYLGKIIALSDSMKQACELIKRVAAAETPVLIVGPNGSGRKLVAETMHANSQRKSKKFVACSCADLTEAAFDEIMASAAASGGTLFLDEVVKLPSALQKKLAVDLKEKKVITAASEAAPLNVRLISSTAELLEEAARKGLFKDDLRKSLTGLTVAIPPLCERREDIMPLACHYIMSSIAQGNPVPQIDAEAAAIIESYDWPGEGDELRQVVTAAAQSAAGGIITPALLPQKIVASTDGRTRSAEDEDVRERNLKRFINIKRKEVLRQVVEEAGGDLKKAATALSVSVAELEQDLNG